MPVARLQTMVQLNHELVDLLQRLDAEEREAGKRPW